MSVTIYPSRKFRLRTTLVIPFVLQIFGAVGLVSYLSFRSGHKAVNDLATQLRSELSARIDGELRKYLSGPHDFNRLNAAAFSEGSFDMVKASNAKQFLTQVQISPFVYSSYCGDSQGQYLGAYRLSYQNSSTIAMSAGNAATDYHFYFYEMDSRGNRRRLLQKLKPYDPRKRPWYVAAIEAKRSIWSEVYLDFASGLPTITASEPVYNSAGKVLGVCATDVVLLEDLRKFLANLAVSQTGQAFIIERSGSMLSSSTNEPLTVGKGKNAKLVIATQSKEPLVQETAQYLQRQFGSFDQIQRSQQLDYMLKGKRQFVQVLPLNDGRGIDWLIVVVVPESDFMGQIYENTQNTLWLTLGALGLALTIGILTARWVTRPIQRVSQASKEIAKGNLDQQIDSSLITEIDTLATSFNRMAGQLQESFTALRQSEARNRALLEAIPDLMLEIDRDGVYLDCIEAKGIKLIYQGTPQNLLGRKIHDVLPEFLVQDYINAIYQALNTHETQTLEYALLIDGQLQTYESRVVASSDRSALFMVRDITKRKQAEEALRLANEELEHRVEQRTAELRVEKERSEQLLLNVLPASIAERLKQSHEFPAEHFEEATILFADIVGFTSLSARLEPMKLVAGLNQIFSAFDQLTEKYDLEKIKTIGDAYMVVGGLPISRPDHAVAIANMALDMQAHMQTLQSDLGESLQLRIGINTGPVIAGVIGIKKFIYDLWGDAVNVASRMESHGRPGYIQVTDTTYARLQDHYVLEPRGMISVKGRGEMMTYWLMDRRSIAMDTEVGRLGDVQP